MFESVRRHMSYINNCALIFYSRESTDTWIRLPERLVLNSAWVVTPLVVGLTQLNYSRTKSRMQTAYVILSVFTGQVERTCRIECNNNVSKKLLNNKITISRGDRPSKILGNPRINPIYGINNKAILSN